jgi:hypothetical protein
MGIRLACRRLAERQFQRRLSMSQTTALLNPSSAALHELTLLEWMRHFLLHLERVRPDLSFVQRLWTAVHWLDRWEVQDPEAAAGVASAWWLDASSWLK